MPKDMANPGTGDSVKNLPVLRVNPSEGSGPTAYLHWDSEVRGLKNTGPMDFKLLVGGSRSYLNREFKVMFVGQAKDWPMDYDLPDDVVEKFSAGLDSWIVLLVSGARVIKTRGGSPSPTLFFSELETEKNADGVITPVPYMDRSVLEEERAKARAAYERSERVSQ